MKAGAWVLLAVLLVYASGCGGGSGSGANTGNIQIQTVRFSPKNVSVVAGSTVTFMNVDAQQHQVFSGTLDPQGSPAVVHLITIANTQFVPPAVEANLGDTIRFSNASQVVFPLQIVDDNGQVVGSFTIPIGNSQDVIFPGAGQFIYRSQSASVIPGTITLFGRPHPSNVFQSPILNNSATFSVRFNNVGVVPFYDLNLNEPNKSFMTGTVSVN